VTIPVASSGSGWVGQAMRVLLATRRGAVSARTCALSQMTVRVLRSTAQRVRALAAEADELEVEITRPERGVAC
jgi:hypothetical protein